MIVTKVGDNTIKVVKDITTTQENSSWIKKGQKMSEETKKKMSLSKMGNKNPAKRLEVREKLSKSHKGKKHTKETKFKMSLVHYGHKTSEKTKRKIGLANKGKKRTEELKQRISNVVKANPIRFWLGKKRSYEDLIKMSKNRIGKCAGENHYNWKGGITPINQALRNCLDYEKWRNLVLERDLYTCQDCGEVGGRLEADHIKLFALFPELRFEVSNGRTLCTPCHRSKTKEDWKIIIEGRRMII